MKRLVFLVSVIALTITNVHAYEKEDCTQYMKRDKELFNIYCGNDFINNASAECFGYFGKPINETHLPTPESRACELRNKQAELLDLQIERLRSW